MPASTRRYINVSRLGELIDKKMEQGLSKSDMCREMLKNVTFLTKVMQNGYCNTLSLQAIAKYFGVSIEYLTEMPKPEPVFMENPAPAQPFEDYGDEKCVVPDSRRDEDLANFSAMMQEIQRNNMLLSGIYKLLQAEAGKIEKMVTEVDSIGRSLCRMDAGIAKCNTTADRTAAAAMYLQDWYTGRTAKNVGMMFYKEGTEVEKTVQNKSLQNQCAATHSGFYAYEPTNPVPDGTNRSIVRLICNNISRGCCERKWIDSKAKACGFKEEELNDTLQAMDIKREDWGGKHWYTTPEFREERANRNDQRT